AVIALAVEATCRDAAKVANARHRNADQTIEKLVHARSAQRHLRADGEALTQLERRDGLASLRDQRLLAGDLGEIRHCGIHHLAIRNGFTNTHVDGDLGDLRNLHHVVDLELLFELRHDRVAIELLQPDHRFESRALDAYASSIS